MNGIELMASHCPPFVCFATMELGNRNDKPEENSRHNKLVNIEFNFPKKTLEYFLMILHVCLKLFAWFYLFDYK